MVRVVLYAQGTLGSWFAPIKGAFDVVVAPRGALGLKGAPEGCVGFVRTASKGAFGNHNPQGMSLHELTFYVLLLSKKIESLEADLKPNKKVYGAAYTKLIIKVKKLEKTVKSSQARRRVKIVALDDEEDSKDSSKQGRMIEEIDQDAGVTLVTPTQGEDQPEDQLGVLSAAKVLADAAKTK
ncbi:hypothetical protein Tco_0088589 [Tanacetum coccineum]